jgi:hypothetical protein
MKKLHGNKVKKLVLVLAVLIVVVVGTLAILPVFSPKVEAGARWGTWFEVWIFEYCGGEARNCVVVWP